MSVFRPYPNQQLRPNGLAPFQTSASGFYTFEGSTPQQIYRGADARAILPALGIAALLAPAPAFVPPAQVQQPTRTVAAVQQQTFVSELAPFFSASSPSVPIPRNDGQAAAYWRAPIAPQQLEPEIAPLVPAVATAYVPYTSVSGVFARAPASALQLQAPGPAALDDTVLVVCGDATQPIAPYIRAPAPPVPQAFSVIAPLAIPPVFVVPPTPLARTPATTYPTQIIEYEVAQFLTGIASAPPLMAANPQAAYLRTPPFVQEPSTDIAPLIPIAADAPLPNSAISAPAYMRTGWSPQQPGSDIAPFIVVAADAPLPNTGISAAAYWRVTWQVQQPENEIASLLPGPAQFVFASSLPIPAREPARALLQPTIVTPAATPFAYTPPAPINGLYARLSIPWPQPKFESAALAAAAPLVPHRPGAIHITIASYDRRIIVTAL